ARRGDAVERDALQRLGPQIVGEDLAALAAGEVAAHGLAHHAQADETELVHRSSRRRELIAIFFSRLSDCEIGCTLRRFWHLCPGTSTLSAPSCRRIIRPLPGASWTGLMNRRLTSTCIVRRWLGLAVLGVAAGLGSCGGGGGGAPSGTPPAGSAPPLISGFTPASAAVGQSVTIQGLNFVAGATTVSFNNVVATGVSAAPTQVIVTVPAGATTGRIKVDTAGGSALSGS